MLSKVTSFALCGLAGVPISVETDINHGLPAFELVGLADAAVKESKERVRSAVKNSARKFPDRKITVNPRISKRKAPSSIFPSRSGS